MNLITNTDWDFLPQGKRCSSAVTKGELVETLEQLKKLKPNGLTIPAGVG